VADFSYTFTYRQSDVPATTGAAPYARVFLDTDGDGAVDRDVVLDPSFCGTRTPEQATDLTFQMIGNSVRYDDDGCDGVPPDQQRWADVVAAHGGEKIIGLLVSQGNSTGHDVSALLRRITVNGTTFAFDVLPVGKTTVVRVPVPVATPTPASGVLGVRASSCKGNKLVTLHAPKRKGRRFVVVSAVTHRVRSIACG
jgi:hypothetical protein